MGKHALGYRPDVEVALSHFFVKAIQLALYGTFKLEYQKDYRFDLQFSVTSKHPTTAIFRTADKLVIFNFIVDIFR